MQQLEVNLSIPIPSDHVLISRVKLKELEEQSLSGVYWSMKDLEQRMNKKHQWIQKHVLYPPYFRNRLDADKGGFVYYPESSGQAWAFQAKKTAEFLDKYFPEIFKGANKTCQD